MGIVPAERLSLSAMVLTSSLAELYDVLDRSMDMDILLLQFCSVAHENMQEHVFIRIAEEFDVLLIYLAHWFQWIVLYFG